MLYVLIGMMIAASIVAVETADLLSSAICVGAVGFALSIIDLLMGAPDLAITLPAAKGGRSVWNRVRGRRAPELLCA